MCFYNLKPLWHVCSHSLRGKAHLLLRSIIKYHLVKILLFRQKSLQTTLQWFLLWAGTLQNQRKPFFEHYGEWNNRVKHDTTVKRPDKTLFFSACRRENIEALPSPCCVPTQFQPLTVLYFHTGDRFWFIIVVYFDLNINAVADLALQPIYINS